MNHEALTRDTIRLLKDDELTFLPGFHRFNRRLEVAFESHATFMKAYNEVFYTMEEVQPFFWKDDPVVAVFYRRGFDGDLAGNLDYQTFVESWKTNQPGYGFRYFEKGFDGEPGKGGSVLYRLPMWRVLPGRNWLVFMMLRVHLRSFGIIDESVAQRICSFLPYFSTAPYFRFYHTIRPIIRHTSGVWGHPTFDVVDNDRQQQLMILKAKGMTTAGHFILDWPKAYFHELALRKNVKKYATNDDWEPTEGNAAKRQCVRRLVEDYCGVNDEGESWIGGNIERMTTVIQRSLSGTWQDLLAVTEEDPRETIRKARK